MTPARRLLGLLLVCAVVFGQWASFAHGLSHARHDLAVAAYAGHGHVQGDGKAPAPLDHSPDQCLEYAGLDCGAAAPQLSLAPVPLCGCFSSPQRPAAPRAADPVPFSSRAPPSVIS